MAAKNTLILRRYLIGLHIACHDAQRSGDALKTLTHPEKKNRKDLKHLSL
jgi:hypothetical protein